MRARCLPAGCVCLSCDAVGVGSSPCTRARRCRRRSAAQSAGFKASPILLLALGVWSALSRRPTPSAGYGLAVAAGLALSACGDVFLEFDDRTSESEAGVPFFLLGLGAFLLGHVAYVVAFMSNGATPAPLNGLPWFIFAAGLVSTLWEHVEAPMRPAVVLYAVVIAFMAHCAFGRSATGMKARPGAASYLAGALGATLFVASDAILAVNRFLTPAPLAAPWGRLAVMGTYYAAQLFIAQSALTNLPWGAHVKLHA